MSEAEIVRLSIVAIEAVIEMAIKLGARDAVLAALDTTLAVARARTDADLRAKHHPIVIPPPPPMPNFDLDDDQD